MDSKEVKRMTVKEFREKGYLQELNRAFLHPYGLAIEIMVDKETETESFGGIWDYRDDPEGLIFDLKNEKDKGRIKKFQENAAFVRSELEKRKPIREKAVGFWQEPIPEE